MAKIMRLFMKLGIFVLLLIIFIGLVAYTYTRYIEPAIPGPQVQHLPKQFAAAGRIVAQDPISSFSLPQVSALSRQNYHEATPPPKYPVVKTTIQYISYDLDGRQIKVFARAYVPQIPQGKAPIFAFAPGTTGIGDQCAASLEQPQKTNWANYESHMITYAGQGYAAIITDYEGMRDPSRLHHYMVGELSGRAVLDSIRALGKLNSVKNMVDRDSAYVAGYSQGGHSAFWADKIASTYAPDLKLRGSIGFGPVTDVARTLADVTRGANINWFGPYVLASYADYYHEDYSPGAILHPQWHQNLLADVTSHCIDTNPAFWGRTPEPVYTPEFLTALRAGALLDGTYSALGRRLAQNTTINAATSRPKLIAQGQLDNVILPAQQTELLPRICNAAKAPVELKIYPKASHYSVMTQSFPDVIAWMQLVSAGRPVVDNCQVS